MKKSFVLFSVLIINSILHSQDILPVQYSFIQPNNINTVISNNGILHYDKWISPGGSAGFIWPVTSVNRLTAIFASGIWIGAKVGTQRELRMAVSLFNSHYTGGHIPVIGQVPPLSVCNDSSWKVYLVNLNDASLVNGGTRTKTAGGRIYSFNYSSWTNWPIAKGAPYVEINNVPGYQPGWNSDRPGIGNGSTARPEEMSFTVYMDYTNCTNNPHISEISLPGGTLPLGVEIHQLSFGFNCPGLINILFTKYRIINKSAVAWDSTYISIANDMDIGYSFDDSYGCDTVRNLTFTLNKDNDDEGYYGANPPGCGLRLLQSPLKYTGNNNDTAKLPYDTLPGYKMIGMSGALLLGVNYDSVAVDPDSAIYGYNLMRGKSGAGVDIINPVTHTVTSYVYSGNACLRTGWLDNNGGDRKHIQNSGPITINSGDTQVIMIAYAISRDGGNNFQNVCALQSLSDSALKYYYNDFQTCIPIGIQPISNEVPERFMLYQNYPNPFNPVTKIKFALPTPGLRQAGLPPFPKGEELGVRVIIYDILGREIATLVNEQLIPGTYEVDWDGTNYSSGVYYYRIITNNYSDTKKMLMVK